MKPGNYETMKKTKTYSVSDAAETLGVSRSTIHNCLRRGLFPNARKGGPFARSRWRIPAGDLAKIKAAIEANYNFEVGE